MFAGKSSGTPGKGPGVCRFCGTTSNTGVLAIGNVCADPDCQVLMMYLCRGWMRCGGGASKCILAACIQKCPVTGFGTVKHGEYMDRKFLMNRYSRLSLS